MITRDEWLSAYAEAARPTVINDPDAFTLQELQETFGGVSWSTAKRRVAKLVRAGRAEETTKRIVVKGNGRILTVMAFRLKA